MRAIGHSAPRKQTAVNCVSEFGVMSTTRPVTVVALNARPWISPAVQLAMQIRLVSSTTGIRNMRDAFEISL